MIQKSPDDYHKQWEEVAGGAASEECESDIRRKQEQYDLLDHVHVRLQQDLAGASRLTEQRCGNRAVSVNRAHLILPETLICRLVPL